MKVLVLAGGDSAEREVSLDSGAAVCEALGRLGHDYIALDASDGDSLLDAQGEYRRKQRKPDQASVKTDTTALAGALARPECQACEVVFIALHGGAGENGEIQTLLDTASLKYTGSGSAASALAMDKAKTKQLMSEIGVATPAYQLYRISDSATWAVAAQEITVAFTLPVIIKTNDGGSTLGLTLLEDMGRLEEAWQLARCHSNEILVEAYVEGRELTVSIVDGQAYPIVEIKVAAGLYDYEAKYTKGKSEYIAPAKLDSDLAQQIKAAALKVYRAVGAEGLARVDFIMDAAGRFFCLELNTLPGMTALSLSPMALKCEGIEFDQLVNMILNSALKRK